MNGDGNGTEALHLLSQARRLVVIVNDEVLAPANVTAERIGKLKLLLDSSFSVEQVCATSFPACIPNYESNETVRQEVDMFYHTLWRQLLEDSQSRLRDSQPLLLQSLAAWKAQHGYKSNVMLATTFSDAVLYHLYGKIVSDSGDDPCFFLKGHILQGICRRHQESPRIISFSLEDSFNDPSVFHCPSCSGLLSMRIAWDCSENENVGFDPTAKLSAWLQRSQHTATTPPDHPPRNEADTPQSSVLMKNVEKREKEREKEREREREKASRTGVILILGQLDENSQDILHALETATSSSTCPFAIVNVSPSIQSSQNNGNDNDHALIVSETTRRFLQFWMNGLKLKAPVMEPSLSNVNNESQNGGKEIETEPERERETERNPSQRLSVRSLTSQSTGPSWTGMLRETSSIDFQRTFSLMHSTDSLLPFATRSALQYSQLQAPEASDFQLSDMQRGQALAKEVIAASKRQ